MAGEPDFSNVVDVLPEEPQPSRTEALADRLESKAAS